MADYEWTTEAMNQRFQPYEELFNKAIIESGYKGDPNIAKAIAFQETLQQMGLDPYTAKAKVPKGVKNTAHGVMMVNDNTWNEVFDKKNNWLDQKWNNRNDPLSQWVVGLKVLEKKMGGYKGKGNDLDRAARYIDKRPEKNSEYRELIKNYYNKLVPKKRRLTYIEQSIMDDGFNLEPQYYA